MKKSKYFGNKEFYIMALSIAIPIMIQNGITNFVSMLDNIMVGRINTDAMSGVSIANQFIFIFNLCIFGAISGPGIFTAQYFGKKDNEGVKQTFRFKIIICIILSLIGIFILAIFKENLISLFLHDGGTTGSIQNTLEYGKQYLMIIVFGLIPFSITQCYSGTLRETGEMIVPMKAGIASVIVNLILDYIFIFGKFGFPVMGVYGAAIATVIARIVELLIVVIWTHKHTERNKFIVGAYRSLYIEKSLVRKIIIKGSPLIINEGLWSLGMSSLVQIYSRGGLIVVAGLNISNTLYNVFNIVFISMGSSIAIIVGQLLGSGKLKEAKEKATKLIVFSVLLCVALGVVLACLSPIFPMLYNTTDEVRRYATIFIILVSIGMPLEAFINASYFTIRSGGKTFITFLFDSVFIWVISIPLAYILMVVFKLNIFIVYSSVILTNLIKCSIGYILVKKDIWIQNLVE